MDTEKPQAHIAFERWPWALIAVSLGLIVLWLIVGDFVWPG